jgi:hypothetical protein
MFSLRKDHFHIFIHGERAKLRSLKEYIRFIYDFGYNFFRSIILKLKNHNKPIARSELGISDEIIIYARTINEIQAFNFLLQTLPSAKCISYGNFAKSHLAGTCVVEVINKKPNFRKFAFLLYLFVNIRYGVKYHKQITAGYELIEEYLSIFSKEKPRIIIISNDHSTDCRAVILAARFYNIPTIYMQHASITPIFPPLRTRYAFLYGNYSKNIYCKMDYSNVEIELVGNPKFDFYKEKILNKTTYLVIGVAFNQLDKLEDVLEFVTQLSNSLPMYELVLRSHPNDYRPIPSTFLQSDSKQETTQDFLSRIDILIAANSNILLEASSMNVLPLVFYYTPNINFMRDYYGFVKTGVAIECKTIEEVALLAKSNLTKPLSTRMQAKVYDASIGSDFEFDVSTRVTKLINDILYIAQ